MQSFLFEKVLTPSAPFLMTQIPNWRELPSDYQSNGFLPLLTDILYLSFFHSPTFDLICPLSIPFVFTSFIYLIEQFVPLIIAFPVLHAALLDWKRMKPSMHQNGHILISFFKDSGAQDILESRLVAAEHNTYSSVIVAKVQSISCFFGSNLGDVGALSLASSTIRI
ncbi:hypothetical protein BLNAU_16820 [Blattamonas nauphoetae]|uniref:Uncharacterized protein n=1 Tax=Blattamonas nauphoetae TaxID=2049346 RepID=A0ABQ9XA54_9EUKA|nr:hypothetical protein BLNAU_16820 [Blattamonas nauphoetae]